MNLIPVEIQMDFQNICTLIYFDVKYMQWGGDDIDKPQH